MGSKAVKSMNFFLFSLSFGLVFWLLAIGEHWKIREKEGFLDLTVLCRVEMGDELTVDDTDLTMRPTSRHQMIS
jgi:hypothetical protein